MAAEIALTAIKKLGLEAFDQEFLLVNFALAVIKKFGPGAFDQESLPVNFTDDFQCLGEELTKLASYLQYADNHAIQNEPDKRWIQQVRDAAWDAEDIIEEHAVESLYGNSSQSSCLCSCIIFQLKFPYNTRRRIKDVRQRMMSIIQDAEVVHKVIHLDDRHSTSRLETLQGGQKPLSFLDSKSPHVAIEDKAKYVIYLWENPEFPAIAVLGMGGMGKIFLLQHVFSVAKQRFAKPIWLCIERYQSFEFERLPDRTPTCMDRRTYMAAVPVCVLHASTKGNIKFALFSLTLLVEENEFLTLKDVAKLINLQWLNITLWSLWLNITLQHEVELKSMEEGVYTIRFLI